MADHVQTFLEQNQSSDPRQTWQKCLQSLPFEWSTEDKYALWQTVFSGQPEPHACFLPSNRDLTRSNLAILLKKKNMSYDEFHRWSVDHRAAYWQEAIQFLNIQFYQAPSQIQAETHTAEYPQWLPGSLFNIAQSCLQGDPNRRVMLAVDETGNKQEFTVGQLKSIVMQVADGLHRMGIGPGDAVAIDLPMNAESVAIYLGVVWVGAAVVSIADSFSAAEIATRLRISKAKLIFTQDFIGRGGKWLPLYQKVMDANAPIAIVLAAKSNEVELRKGDLAWDEFLGSKQETPAYLGNADHVINILFSSGTTGDPKAIPWTQTTPIKAAADGAFHQDIQMDDVVAWPTNLGWMMGPWLLFASLLNRSTLALYEGVPTSEGFLRFVTDQKITVLGLVPSLVKAWRRLPSWERTDWRHLKCFSSTGECSNQEDMFALMCRAHFRPVIEYCGGTEIGGAYLTGTLVQVASPGTFTTPALGLDLVLLDGEGKACSTGEVFLIPPSMGLSEHLLNRDHHKTYFEGVPGGPQNQVLRRHGDELQQQNGFFRALGRADDTMNLGGIKVSSAELERVMGQIEGVLEIAAVAIAPLGGGPSELHVFVVGPKDIHAELQNAIRNNLNPLFKIKEVHHMDKLPRTASGKIMRRMLRPQVKR